jgi:hypothetical protein
MAEILEILKYTIPALIVFAAVYFIIKNFLNQQYQLENLKFRQSQGKDSFGLKIQSLERLTMFVERIDVDNLHFRLLTPEVGPTELRNMMMIAIQHEYEHNAAQQLFVSDSLWKIIKLSKEQTQDIIATAKGETNIELMNDIHKIMNSTGVNPTQIASSAIRNEASILLA